MDKLARYAERAAAIVAILLALAVGMVLVCFGVPFAFGIGCDIIARPGRIALGLEAAAAIMLWRIARRAPQAAKSIT